MTHTRKWQIIFYGFLTKNFINKNPKCSVLVISDRNDLDDQTYQTFKKADKYLLSRRQAVLGRQGSLTTPWLQNDMATIRLCPNSLTFAI